MPHIQIHEWMSVCVFKSDITFVHCAKTCKKKEKNARMKKDSEHLLLNFDDVFKTKHLRWANVEFNWYHL